MAKLNDLTTQIIPNSLEKNNASKPISNRRRTWLEDEEDEKVVLINTDDITNWEFHDRPSNELGDIDSLANELTKIGQLVPCIVRCTAPGSKYKYELIAGERRWRAAQTAKLKLKCIIKDITDTDAALIQSAENDNRKDLSDFAKGISYSKLIDSGIIKQQDLVEKLGRNKQYISALLSFSKIPNSVLKSIGDLSKVSFRTAETIKRLCNKGDSHVNAIISLSSQISEGSIGANKLSSKVEHIVSSPSKSNRINNTRVKTKDGRHIFTWRNDNNNIPSIHFPKDIASLIQDNKISIDNITNIISTEINNELSKMK